MNRMLIGGLIVTAALLAGTASAGEGPGGGPRGKWQEGRGKGAGGERGEAGMRGGGGPGAMGMFGIKILMEKEDVKAEVAKHQETMKGLQEKIKALRESVTAASTTPAATASTPIKDQIAAILEQVIDEKIRHADAMVGFMKKYRSEIVADMKAKLDEKGDAMKERRENRGKGGEKDDANTGEYEVF